MIPTSCPEPGLRSRPRAALATQAVAHALRQVARFLVRSAIVMSTLLLVATTTTHAAGASAPQGAKVERGSAIDLRLPLPSAERKLGETAAAVRVVLGLTLLAVLPSLLVCMTAFLRIVIVLSMLRHAIGMPETPPNTVIIGLALFLTLFTMSPVLQQLNTEALQPFMAGRIGIEQGIDAGMRPLREFMCAIRGKRIWR